MLVCLPTSLSTSIVRGHLIDHGYKYHRICGRSEHSSHLGQLAWSSPSPSLRSTLGSWSCLSNLGSVSRNRKFRKFNHTQILIDYTHVRSTRVHVACKAHACRIWDPRGKHACVSKQRIQFWISLSSTEDGHSISKRLLMQCRTIPELTRRLLPIHVHHLKAIF